jgi:hypothetical protein
MKARAAATATRIASSLAPGEQFATAPRRRANPSG